MTEATKPSNPQLQRYELWSNGVALEHAERGGWVKYEDALAAIERLRAALAEAMEWNWLDPVPPPPEVVGQCEQALHGVPLPPRVP